MAQKPSDEELVHVLKTIDSIASKESRPEGTRFCLPNHSPPKRIVHMAGVTNITNREANNLVLKTNDVYEQIVQVHFNGARPDLIFNICFEQEKYRQAIRHVFRLRYETTRPGLKLPVDLQKEAHIGSLLFGLVENSKYSKKKYVFSRAINDKDYYTTYQRLLNVISSFFAYIDQFPSRDMRCGILNFHSYMNGFCTGTFSENNTFKKRDKIMMYTQRNLAELHASVEDNELAFPLKPI